MKDLELFYAIKINKQTLINYQFLIFFLEHIKKTFLKPHEINSNSFLDKRLY